MRTTLLINAWIALALVGCGPSPGSSASDGSTGTASASSGPTSGASDGSSTGHGGTTAGTSTGEVTTGTAATGTGTSTTGTSTSTSTSTSTTAGTGDTTTGAPGTTCVGDVDCALHSDCCTCEGVHVLEEHPVCDEECPTLKCAAAGVDAAICRLGVCITERLSCDATKVTCKAAQPDCPPGTLAETTPDCWTGKCVPAEHCDAVPECSLCPGGWMCVQDVAFGPQGWPRCEPIPAACGGVVDCDCVGEAVCVEPFSGCFAQGTTVSCECVTC